jgi:hypothetical protein
MLGELGTEGMRDSRCSGPGVTSLWWVEGRLWALVCGESARGIHSN